MNIANYIKITNSQKFFIVILAFITTFVSLTAQEKELQFPTVISPSPNAAALGLFGNVPVGYYTGIPQITIPLYEIRSGSISVPIKLDYHASGIKVIQDASWVGLGWALNAGGVITRNIRGQDDLGTGYSTYGFPYVDPLPNADLDNNVIWTPGDHDLYLKTKSYADGVVDSEPDIFYYNFGNYSGKMIFPKLDSNSPSKPILINQEALDVEYFKNNRSWQIKTPDGCTYYFGTGEYTTILRSETLEKKIPFAFEDANSTPICNSWYLDSIISPEGDKIKFEYSDSTPRGTKSRQFISQFYTKTEHMKLVNKSTGSTTSPIVFNSDTYTASAVKTSEIYLSRIVFDNGNISFITKDRSDLLTTDLNTFGNPQCLDKIIVRNNLSEVVNSFSLDTDYFIGIYAKRLKLNRVTDLSGATHIFEYNKMELPAHESFAIDHWGLYNGQSNNKQLIPSITSEKIYYSGANREPSEEHAKANILTRINYPTGGYSEFNYELNDYSNFSRIKPVLTDESIFFYGNYGSINTQGIARIDTITPAYFDVEVQFPEKPKCFDDQIYSEDFSSFDRFLTIERSDDGNSWDEVGDMTYYSIRCADVKNEIYRSTNNRLKLHPGIYRFTTNPKKGFRIIGHLFYQTKDFPSIVKGGGLRIKNINHSDGNNISNIKYEYTIQDKDSVISSGKLMTYPIYHAYRDYRLQSTTVQAYTEGTYIQAYSDPVFPLTTAQGSYLGYSQVAEIRHSDLDSVKTIYVFNNQSNNYYQTDHNWFPGIPGEEYNGNGQLLQKNYYDNQNRLVKEEKMTYALKNRIKVKGLKSLYYFENLYGLKLYDIISDWRYLTEHKITNYDYTILPIQKSTTINKYTYNNLEHKQLTSQTSNNSDGTISKINYKYPMDYKVSPYIDMANNFIINPIVATEKSITSPTQTKIIDAEIIEYRHFHSKFFKPTSRKRLRTNLPIISGTDYSNKMEYVSHYNYNTKGRLIESKFYDKPETVYIWSYKGQYPIAEIINANYMQIRDALGGQIEVDRISNSPFLTKEDNLKLNKLRKNPIFKHALINTYTYNPLIGITSATATNGVTHFYNYDKIGRLIEIYVIENDEKRIIEEYKYNYKQNE